MGALANELHCSRCNTGTGMDNGYLPHSWAVVSISDLDAMWTGYLCEACRSEFHDWTAQQPTP